MNEMKNVIQSICSSARQVEERSNLEDRNVEVIQLEEKRKQEFKKSKESI